MDIDVSQVRQLAVDLGGADRRVTLESAAVMRRAAVNIKKGLQAQTSGHPHFPGLGRAVSFDERGLSFEVGPTLGGQGSLGGVFWEGTARNGPVADFMAPVRAEEPLLAYHLADVATRAVFR